MAARRPRKDCVFKNSAKALNSVVSLRWRLSTFKLPLELLLQEAFKLKIIKLKNPQKGPVYPNTFLYRFDRNRKPFLASSSSPCVYKKTIKNDDHFHGKPKFLKAVSKAERFQNAMISLSCRRIVFTENAKF